MSCMFHRWSNWTLPFNSMKLRWGDFGKNTLTPVVVQTMTCSNCGMVLSRVVREGTVEDSFPKDKQGPLQ